MSFPQKALPNGMKSDQRTTANIRHLTRILIYLSEVEYDNKTNMGRNCCMDRHTYLNSAIKFLLDYEFIYIVEPKVIKRNHSVKFYAIYPSIKYLLNRKNAKSKEEM